MSGRFRQRPTRYIEVSSIRGWRLKRYEITRDGEPIAHEIHDAVNETLAAALPEVPDGEAGIGFLIVHRREESLWVLAGLWTGDILSQHTFNATLDAPTAIRAVPPGGPTACVWELSVHAHERDAFVQHVLDPASGPDAERYLGDTLTVRARSNRELVEEFNRARAEGDVDALMAVMSPDPTYRASTGTDPGHVYSGRDEVRAGLAKVIRAEAEAVTDGPVAPPGELHILGSRGLSFWSYNAPDANGRVVRVEGVDVWTFSDGLIFMKDAYRKSFPDPS